MGSSNCTAVCPTCCSIRTLDEADLNKVVKLGGYEMEKGEIVAQIWIHHAIAHAYEASARWPIT